MRSGFGASCGGMTMRRSICTRRTMTPTEWSTALAALGDSITRKRILVMSSRDAHAQLTPDFRAAMARSPDRAAGSMSNSLTAILLV